MLFTDTLKLQEYAELTGKPNFIGLMPTLRLVEQLHIIPILGTEQYNDLNIAIADFVADNTQTLTEAEENLLLQCRMAIGPLFCFYYADKADVKLSEAGMQRVETTNNKSAYQEQRTKFKEANLAEGENALELLIKFLEDNKDDYPAWAASNNFKQYRSLFIKTGFEFNDIFPSASPYRNYWSMRTKMVDVEENNIRPFLGDTLYIDLKAKSLLDDPGFSADEILLLSKLKKVIANFTVAFAVPLLSVRISGNGLTVPAVTFRATNDDAVSRSRIDDKLLVTFANTCSSTATDWLNNTRDFLTTKQTSFPDWIGFAVVTDDDDDDNPRDQDWPGEYDKYDAVFGM
jgi:hypothetical protein